MLTGAEVIQGRIRPVRSSVCHHRAPKLVGRFRVFRIGPATQFEPLVGDDAPMRHGCCLSNGVEPLAADSEPSFNGLLLVELRRVGPVGMRRFLGTPAEMPVGRGRSTYLNERGVVLFFARVSRSHERIRANAEIMPVVAGSESALSNRSYPRWKSGHPERKDAVVPRSIIVRGSWSPSPTEYVQ